MLLIALTKRIKRKSTSPI